MIELQGNIELVGFKDMDKSELVVVKKMVGNYTRRLSEMCEQFERITITKKDIHKDEPHQKVELHAKILDKGSLITAEAIDTNFFVALDDVLKRLETQLEKKEK